MWMVVIVVVCPLFSHKLQLLKIIKDVGVKDVFSECPVEAFDIGILSRLPWLNMMNFHALSRAPLREHLTDELRAIIPLIRLGSPYRVKAVLAPLRPYRQGKTVLRVPLWPHGYGRLAH